jgi:CBS domain-containing protein
MSVNIRSILATQATDVVTIRPDQSLKEAVALLARHQIGALVVVDEMGRPLGIISERDVIREVADREDVFSQAVAQVMTTDLVTGLPQDDLRSVAYTMTDRGIRHLPIVDEERRLVGIVSIRDVVKAQRDRYEGEIDTLETQVIEGED